jgi:hypothetical protein
MSVGLPEAPGARLAAANKPIEMGCRRDEMLKEVVPRLTRVKNDDGERCEKIGTRKPLA